MTPNRLPLMLLFGATACVGARKEVPEVSESATPSTHDSGTRVTDTGTPPEPPPCVPVTEGSVWTQDQDGDCVQGLLDCDDLDPDVNDAAEVCDGKDNDCDGAVDEGALLTWFLDVDGDGWAGEQVETCSMPEPWLPGEPLGTDCDDTDATIHPEQVLREPVTGIEIPGDGVDQDCDGEDACGPVCVGTQCGFDTTAEAEAFCDTWGQAAWIDVTVPGPDLAALDCLCTPPEVVEINVYDGSGLSLSGLENWFPTETLRFEDASEGSFDFSGLEGVDEILPTVVVQCGGTAPSRFDVHFTGLSSVERLGGLVFGDLGEGCYNTGTAVDLTGLDRVRIIDGDLDLFRTRIRSLHGLEALEEVGGSVSIDEPSNGLSNINPLSALRRVGGDVYIEPDVDLAPLAGLESVGGTLDLQGVTVPTFAQLEHVGGLFLNGVPGESMAQFGWVTALSDDLDVWATDGTSISGLDHVSSVGGVLSLKYNSSLTSAEGLGAVASVGASLLVYQNTSLRDLTGLSSITTVGHYLEVAENPALTSLNGLSALTSLGYDMEILENEVLTGLDGLTALTDVSGSVLVEANPVLDLEAGFPLARVDAHFVLVDNPSLTTLDGLGSLRRISGTLYIANNDQLTSLKGLYGLTWIGGDVWFQGNARLSDEEIYAFLDHIGRENIGLRVIIEP